MQLKDHPQRSSFYPKRSSSSKSPTELINRIPSGVIVKIFSRTPLPHRVFPLGVTSSSIYSPNGVLLSYRFSIFVHHPAETKNSTVFSSSSRIYFPQLKHYMSIHHATCIYASYHKISFILRTSLPDTYHALHTANLYLSGKIQSKFKL